MLKFTVTSSLIIFSSTLALAMPSGLSPVEGDFALSDRMEVSSVRRYEKVDVLVSNGSARLKELKSQGYICRQQAPLKWICGITISSMPMSEYVESQVREKWSGLLISFRPQAGDSMIVEQTQEATMWVVPQEVFVRTSVQDVPQSWDQVSYVVPKGASDYLIFLGDYRDIEAPSLKVIDENTLLIQDMIEVESENAILRYFVDISISRIQ